MYKSRSVISYGINDDKLIKIITMTMMMIQAKLPTNVNCDKIIVSSKQKGKKRREEQRIKAQKMTYKRKRYSKRRL